MVDGVFSDLVASWSGGWSIFRFCGFGQGGVMGGLFSDFVASGNDEWSIFRFCGFGQWWVEYFQILWFRGEVVEEVMGGVFADFVASGSGR